MSLVINTNEQATRIHGVYNRNNTMMNSAMTKVATAQKINSARDGASNWAISEKMRERMRANDQANQNVQNDTALLKTAQGGIDNTIDILKTLKERAINAANDSNTTDDRKIIAEEVYQLFKQIDDNAAKVKFNGRTLLDGSLAAGVESIASTSSADGSSSGVTATNPKGSAAVYSITPASGLKVSNGTSASGAESTSLLTSLSSNGTDRLFQDGDTITLSWTENGASKSKDYTVTTASKVSDLSGLSNSQLTVGWVADGTAVGSVKKADGTDYETNSTGGAGLYIYGADEIKIANVSLSVTYKDVNGVTQHRTETEEALGINALQQTYGEAKGSNAIYGSQQSDDTKAVTGTNGNDTKLVDLKTGSNKVITSGAASDNVTFTVNGNQSVTVGANATINELNDAFKQSGINVRAQLASAGDTLTYDGTPVTRGSGSDASDFTASVGGLYFIGAPGESISSVAMSAVPVAGGTARTIHADSGLASATSVLELANGGSSSSNNSGSLTFHVGGEADFYMDIGIRNMTASSLLGGSASSFSALFTDKASARNVVSTIDTALQTALNEQTRLGSIEARLGYTSDNIITMNENLEAADSAYRDADIAKEMTNYMKYAVLSQSAQYMLAQAGQNGYQVLNLLNA